MAATTAAAADERRQSHGMAATAQRRHPPGQSAAPSVDTRRRQAVAGYPRDVHVDRSSDEQSLTSTTSRPLWPVPIVETSPRRTDQAARSAAGDQRTDRSACRETQGGKAPVVLTCAPHTARATTRSFSLRLSDGRRQDPAPDSENATVPPISTTKRECVHSKRLNRNTQGTAMSIPSKVSTQPDGRTRSGELGVRSRAQGNPRSAQPF